MDAPLGGEGGEDSCLLDVIASENMGKQDSQAYNKDVSYEIERSLNTLTARQQDVIKLYFGIGVEHHMSLEDIGEKFGLTRERVRQVKDKAINKLRSGGRSKLLKHYLGN
jgi:RNA polymerase primary sigma factor